jgi:murein DD-endopeptidase MepM/ murein hydrolase activator NlpD
MIPEPTNFFFDTLVARITSLERDNALMQAALDTLKPDWRKAQGTSGTMTGDEHSHGDEIEGYITPKTSYGANIREWASTASDNPPLYWMELGQSRNVTGYAADAQGKINPATGNPFVWYHLDDDNFVREDVVTFTPDKPITPINAALWPAPVTNYTITNTHKNHRDHHGLDYACKRDTPILCGPNGGTVVKVFICDICNAKGDGISTWGNPDYGYGWVTFVIIRYDYAALPALLKGAIPKDAYAFCLYAHMSSTPLNAYSVGKTLEPYQEIGKVGATGNTYGVNPEHLHIEARFSTDPKASFFAITQNEFDPSLQFKA